MYKTVVVAGTFDGLHAGHEAVLARAFAEGERVLIGLTSDSYIERFKIHDSRFMIQESIKRKEKLEAWLQQKGLESRTTIVPLDDPYGPALTEQFDALVVTADNKVRGEEINGKRKEKGLPPIALIEVPLVPAEDLKPISSTRLRKQEIDREGHLVLPDALRPELAKPLGTVLVGDEIHKSMEKNNGKIVITVGDLTTKTLFDAGIIPTLSIIDGRLMRNPFPDAVDLLQQKNIKTLHINSGPGYISNEAISAIQNFFVILGHRPEDPVTKTLGSRLRGNDIKTLALIIEGEEDLLTLPAVVYAPLGSVLYYGQPHMSSHQEGMVEVVITPQIQAVAHSLLSRFTF